MFLVLIRDRDLQKVQSQGTAKRAFLSPPARTGGGSREGEGGVRDQVPGTWDQGLGQNHPLRIQAIRSTIIDINNIVRFFLALQLTVSDASLIRRDIGTVLDRESCIGIIHKPKTCLYDDSMLSITLQNSVRCCRCLN